MNRKLTWRDRVRPFIERVAPAARMVDRVSYTLLQLKKPTIVGVTSVLGTAANAANDVLFGCMPGGWSIPLPVSRTYMVDAFKQGGARVSEYRDFQTDTERLNISWHGFRASINSNDRLSLHYIPDDETLAWISQLLDAVLPSALEIRVREDHDGQHVESLPITLDLLRSTQGEAIWSATAPLLEGGRCILLNGRPGVGKTTMAREIATVSGLGRVVLLEAALVGSPRDDSAIDSINTGELVSALRLIQAGTIIVDDVDKIHLRLPQLEALRRIAKLVILTANNGEFDEVLDGAMIRAGRVDEVFDIVPQPVAIRAPFDKLSATEWAEVSQWPIAYLNEVEKRLVNRPGDLRLDDLRHRLQRRVRSGDQVR